MLYRVLYIIKDRIDMEFKAKCKEVENKEDYYDFELSTYKEKISFRCPREDIRHLIQILDNSINVGQ